MKRGKISPALRISIMYALTGGAWILLSDYIIGVKFPTQLTAAQTYKGWFFIAGTACILFILLRNEKNALKKAEQSFSDLFASSIAGIFRSSPQGRFISVNAAMADIFGYDSPTDMIEHVTDISAQIHLSAKSRGRFIEALERDGIVEKFEAVNRKKDGSLIWTATNARAVQDENGNVLYYEGFVADITKQKNAENALRDAEERYRTLIENLPAVVFMDKFDDAQSSTYISPRLEDLLGYTPDEWNAGENMWETLLHPQDRERVLSEDAKTNQSEEPFRIEYRLRHKRGHYVWIKEDASIVKGENGSPLFWQGILLDITAQKQAEEKLKRRDAILKAVGVSAEQFLQSANWEDCIDLVLEELGKATQVSRVYVMRKYLSPENIVMISQISEWCGQEAEPQISNAELQDKDFAADGFMRWIQLFDNGQPVYGSIKDFPEKERGFLEKQNILSLICIPLLVEKNWWGFIGFDECDRDHEWGEVEVDTLKAAATTLSAAIKKKMVEEDLHKQFKELTVLHAVALAESTAQNMDDLIQQVTDIIGDLLYPDNCGIVLVNESGDMLQPHASYRGISRDDLACRLPTDMGLTGKVISSGQSIRTGNVLLEPEYYEATKGIRSELCVPIRNAARVVGALNVESRQPNAFTRSDERLLNTIAGGMAKAIERIHLFELEKRRRRQAEILREITGELTSLFETETLFENIFNSLAKLIGYDSASIEFINQGEFEIIAVKNIAAALIGKRYKANVEKWGDFINERQPIIIDDAQQDERFEKFAETNHIHGWMAIPLFVKGRVVGFLNLDSFQRGFFNKEHAAIAQTFANQVAIAMENTRLFEQERHRRSQAEILSQATSALANTLDMNSLFECVLDWLQKIAPYDSASIMLNSENEKKLAAKRHIPDQYRIGQVFPMTEKWHLVASNRKPLILEDAQNNEIFEKWENSEYIRGWMCVAMFAQDKLVGFINLDSRKVGAFTEEHSVLAQTFANQAATALENARLFQLEQKRRKNAEIVRQATTVLATLLDRPALHDAILEWVYKITPYDSASILELEGQRIRISAARGSLIPDQALDQTFPSENALCKTMSETYEPVIIEDCETDGRFEKWGGIQNVRGWMGVPMISRGQIIGYITLDGRKPRAFSQNDAVAVQTFAHQAATSLENSRLFTETRQRLEELEVVSRVSFALRAAHDTQEMLPILLDEIKTSMGADSTAIWLYETEKDELIARTASGQFESHAQSKFKPREGIVGAVYSNGTAHVANSADRNFYGNGESGITVPIRTASETIGALAVALDAPRKITPSQTRLITTLAEIAGNAIYRSTLYEKSEEQIQRLTTLRELDTAIASSLDLRLTLGILTERLLSQMGASAAGILVFNPESQTLNYYAAAGFKNQKDMPSTVRLGDGLASQILLSRKPFHIKDLKSPDASNQPKPLRHEQFTSYYAAPLFSKGAARGILETYFRDSFSPNADWVDFIHTLGEQAVIAIDNAQLFENLQQTNQELSLAYDITLEGWGRALELHDKEPQGHTRRATELTLKLARQMGVPETELLQIRRGALLHDIGKMGVPDHILLKNDELTAAERAEVQKHPQYAYETLHPIEYLRPALEIAYSHHEWWNGGGYPLGLKGENIPLAARIFAIVDVWDALSSDRPYRKAWERGKILQYLHHLSGKQFDPQVAETFFRILENEGQTK